MSLVLDALKSSAQPSLVEKSFADEAESMIPWDKLEAGKSLWKSEYDVARPYPHVVIDGLWDEWVLDRIIAEFPARGKRDWIDYDTVNEMKQTSRGLYGLKPFTQLFLLQVCSPRFLNWVGEITNIQGITPDPLYHGGGLHESVTGGHLNVHADWTKHPVLPLARQCNMIIYLNKDWQADWGGDLGLFDPVTKECGATVSPVFNRTVIFPTTSETLHGFPSPIRCPADRTRQSVSLFYWNRDQDAIKSAENINFLPGRQYTKTRAFLRSCTPPIAFTLRDQLVRLLNHKK